MDSTPFYGERGPIPFFLGRKSSVCKKRLWTKWFYILSQPLFACRKIPRAGMSSPENESVEKSNYGKTSRILYFAGL